MSEIKAGSNGVILEHPITCDGEIVLLTGSTVTVVFKTSKRRFEKQAQITDDVNGICQVTLTSDDLSEEGVYELQGTVYEASGSLFISDIVYIKIGEKI
ncbi:hypothetical protein [Heyndrickxia acidicola]|uniref:Uncharacterized protein n=1 Tax=Heyndrickxia acidicola TaxID=209389 RepID=A0ABU6MMD8_9BACI|nr:hypothetical protein [Heyndrickxia acidicola]MED1205856.1 hypothetical protein [Heyndrickxia acidicola]